MLFFQDFKSNFFDTSTHFLSTTAVNKKFVDLQKKRKRLKHHCFRKEFEPNLPVCSAVLCCPLALNDLWKLKMSMIYAILSRLQVHQPISYRNHFFWPL